MATLAIERKGIPDCFAAGRTTLSQRVSIIHAKTGMTS
jgi:hypothetical protein